MADGRPVGVFDSGVGGISTLGALRRELPGERFIYYGDTLHAPYGTKTAREVFACADAVFTHLLGRGCKAVVIACNTATSAAAAQLRAARPDFPILGMEPALKPAAILRHGGRILVLATPTTLRLDKFRRLMARWGDGAVPVPCPGLMELVEGEDADGARAYLREILRAHGGETLDAIVLGCTHYSFLKPALRELLPPETAVLDGNAGTARQLRRVLTERDLLAPAGPGGVELETSGDPDSVLPLMRRLLAAAERLAADEENIP